MPAARHAGSSAGFARRQVEDPAILRPLESSIQPSQELCSRRQRGQSLMFESGEHSTAENDLAPRIPLPFGPAGSSRESIAFGPQPSQPFIEGLNANANLFGLCHVRLRSVGRNRPAGQRSNRHRSGLSWSAQLDPPSSESSRSLPPRPTPRRWRRSAGVAGTRPAVRDARSSNAKDRFVRERRRIEGAEPGALVRQRSAEQVPELKRCSCVTPLSTLQATSAVERESVGDRTVP